MRSNRPKSSKGPRKNKGRGPFRGIGNAGDVIIKRMTSSSTLATGAGTTIPLTFFTTAQVESTPASEWASFQARYQQYRVRAIRVHGKATQPVQLATVAHSILYQGDFIGASVPGSAAQLLSDERVKESATYKDFMYMATWSSNPNAKLWNPVSAGIPVANVFGIAVGSPAAPALTTATTYYAVVIEWEVELRGSQ